MKLISSNRSGTMIGTIVSLASIGGSGLLSAGCESDQPSPATIGVSSSPASHKSDAAFEQCGWEKAELASLREAYAILQEILPPSDPRRKALKDSPIVAINSSDPVFAEAAAYYDRLAGNLKIDPAILKNPFVAARYLAHESFHIVHHKPMTVFMHEFFKREIEAHEDDLLTIDALREYGKKRHLRAHDALVTEQQSIEKTLAGYRVKYSLAVISEQQLHWLTADLTSANNHHGSELISGLSKYGRNLAALNTVYLDDTRKFLAALEKALHQPEIGAQDIAQILKRIESCRKELTELEKK